MPSTVIDRLYGLTTSVAVKAPVRAISTANLVLEGLQTVNAVVLAEGDRVLVKDQTDPVENGIYNASSSEWTRTGDCDGVLDLVQGTMVVNESSAVLFYRCVTDNPIVIGESEIEFELLEILDSDFMNRIIATQHSLTGGGDLSADRTLNLVNDEASPGNSKYYGTNGAGTRGWFASAAAGITDHGALSGLADDDHPQYALVSRLISTQHSLTGGGSLAANRTLNLVNDEASPGNSQYYGTDSGGTRGWFASASEVGPRVELLIQEDFEVESSNAGINEWDEVATTGGGTGGSIAYSTAVGHPGIVRLTMSTSATGSFAMVHAVDGASPAATGIMLGGGAITIDFVFRFITALPVETTDDYRIRLGICSSGIKLATEGVFIGLDYSAGIPKLIGVTRDASVDTTTTAGAGVTAVLNQWHQGKIAINSAGNSIEFFVDGVSLGTLASGIPAVVLTPTLHYYGVSTGTNKAIEIDLFQMRQVFATPRFT